ncbi:DUF4912 domain-containing protein [Prochlorococcus marinus]|uniref:DUF4912 domain-containing protein n=1 Tax=Prochlorococcus marinus TaxID=1219 RepID=UPI0022B2CCB4|nr:DUF4912 domain-containing protein [Prochlorococcus marinus]
MNFSFRIKRKLKEVRNRILNKIVQRNSYISSRFLTNNLVKFNWTLSDFDKHQIHEKSIYCLCLRMFDITSGKSKNNSTCIMKEIEVNKKINELFTKPPVKDGKLLIEIGFRKPLGQWNILAFTTLDLGLRENLNLYPDDSWFYSSSKHSYDSMTIHERMYQLARLSRSGGSEKIQQK